MTIDDAARPPDGTGDLARRLRQARAELLALDRTLTALAAAYDELPDGSLSEADRAARIEIIDSLSDTQIALGEAGEPFASALWNADRLAGEPAPGHT
ncbi:hypothetical protein RE9431_49700 (plasmid) [Prescottella equi]|uniref:hypothetical protein n=1 Tax=Rhodococcus hoagii TaxID=43767 RepID=UPI001C79A121|nr:hypothetical protein [Prescottella equi]BCN66515.1 hypothetical protein RE9431_49700 [Prescottella equi]